MDLYKKNLNPDSDYPYLEEEDIKQSLRYAAWLAEEAIHPLEIAFT